MEAILKIINDKLTEYESCLGSLGQENTRLEKDERNSSKK